jgi:hypothetical protein
MSNTVVKVARLLKQLTPSLERLGRKLAVQERGAARGGGKGRSGAKKKKAARRM